MVLGSRTQRAGHGTIQPPASRAMIAGMGKAQDPGPGSRVDNPQDVQVTGDLPVSLTAFVGRERELDELRELVWPVPPLSWHHVREGNRNHASTLYRPQGCVQTRSLFYPCYI